MHIIKLLMSLLLCGYGSYLIYQGLYLNYQPVSAIVIESDKAYIDTSPNRPGSYFYTFEYEYTYRNKRYVSDQYTYGGRDAAEAVCRYKSGDSLTAYVNPQSPGFAIIKREVSGFVIALTVVGFLMLAHTVLAYLNEVNQNNTPQFLQKAHNFMGPLIGLTILLGGIGYFVYTLVLAATAEYVH